MTFFDSRMKTLLKNISGSAVARFMNLLISLAMVPLTLQTLSPTDYAYFAIAVSISILATYADLGLGFSIVSIVAGRKANPTSGDAQKAVSIVWFSLLTMAAAGLIFIVLLSVFLSQIPKVSWGDHYNAMILAAALVFAGLPTGLVQRILFAEQKTVQANAWTTGAKAISLAVVWTLVNLNISNLYFFVFAVIGVPVIVGWISAFVVFQSQSAKDLWPNWGSFNFGLMRQYLPLGLSFLLLQTVPYIETGMDSLLIGFLVNLALVPAFDVHLKLFAFVPAIISISIVPIWPALSSAKASGDEAWIARVRRWGYLAVVSISVVVSMLLVVNSESVIFAWTNKQLHIEQSVVIGLGFFCVLSSIGLFQSMYLNGIGNISGQLKIYAQYLPVLLVLKMLSALAFGLEGMVWTLNLCYLWRLYRAEKLIGVKPAA